MKKLGILVITALLLISARSVSAVELITNGGFETGNFTGWTATNPTGPFEPWAVSGSGGGWVDSPLPSATQVIHGNFNAWNTVTSSPAGSFTLVQQVAVPSGNISILRWSHRYQMNLSAYCNSSATCGTATYAVEILNTSNVVLATLYTITTPSLSNTNTGWQSYMTNLSAFGGQTIRLRYRTTVTAAFGGPGKIEIDGVSINSLPPTASEVSVGGRVMMSDGSGISGAQVSLADSIGNIRSVTTSPLGYYLFDAVETGHTYVISVNKKNYSFIDSPRLVAVEEEIGDLDFISP